MENKTHSRKGLRSLNPLKVILIIKLRELNYKINRQLNYGGVEIAEREQATSHLI